MLFTVWSRGTKLLENWFDLQILIFDQFRYLFQGKIFILDRIICGIILFSFLPKFILFWNIRNNIDDLCINMWKTHYNFSFLCFLVFFTRIFIWIYCTFDIFKSYNCSFFWSVDWNVCNWTKLLEWILNLPLHNFGLSTSFFVWVNFEIFDVNWIFTVFNLCKT